MSIRTPVPDSHRTTVAPPTGVPQRAGETLHVVIVGGGIGGLSTAWYLQKQAGVRYTLLEQSGRWGGKIQTEHVESFNDGPFVVEGGPDSFLTQKPWAWQLAHELGLERELIGTNDHMRRVFVLNRGKLTPLPDGVLMIVPTRFMPFVLSPLISLPGKLRMGMDLFIRPRRDGQDETLADFIRRRLGAEALDKLAEPLMSGIYNAEAERQSLLATFPRFRTLEEKYGSLTRGMIAARKRGRAPRAPATEPRGPTSMFVSLRGGTQILVDTLVSRLSGDLRLDSSVTTIRRDDGGYEVVLADGSSLPADAVILATPAYVAARMVREVAPQAAEKLDAIRYVSTGTISLAFRREEISHPLDGFGIVIPRSEDRPINAVTWTSTKFEQRAPHGTILLRVFFGGSRRPEMMTLSDDDLLRVVLGELRNLMNINTRPLFHRIHRWHRANPQYDVGHLEHVDAIETTLPPGLYVTGSAYRGIGIPDCVRQAQQTAQQVLTALASNRQRK